MKNDIVSNVTFLYTVHSTSFPLNQQINQSRQTIRVSVKGLNLGLAVIVFCSWTSTDCLREILYVFSRTWVLEVLFMTLDGCRA